MRGAKVPQLDAIKRKEFMTQPDIIQTILKDSNYHLDLFDESEI